MGEMMKLTSRPISRRENVIQGKKYRITMLTEGLVRLEYSEEGNFEDRPTQTVLNRDFPSCTYTVKETEEEIQVFTKRIHLIYNKKEFASYGLSIQVLGNLSNYHSIWHYGEEPEDLGGTARTLDRVDGACPLEHGLMSRFGFSVMDDSCSLVLTEDGWVEPRRKGIKDIYFWGYGHDYFQCLNDFYYLCGKTPMLPRYALGNWWSRYYEYTEDSYKELMERFEEEGVPFSVAVIDMDWHLVNVDAKYGSGWTGYTWNRDFFPDPERFMTWLHDRGMKVTLNVHPADGIRAYEEMYEEMAEAMDVDPKTQEPVNFDISDPKFLKEYFEIVHHPNEKMGVDFWWIDWQQGTNSKIEGLDPLWMLNHYHYLDNGRDGKRPMVFSRYAGPGSHRYPAGFSGDAHTTWESLDFQPYFTSTASNIGYGWWSHDIGGHMQGYKNDQMALRWLQLGVFSPLNRLHSTKDLFYSKEPWFYKKEMREIMDEFLRLRHKLLPYLYTMNYRAYKENIPLILPMYYTYPETEEAYEVKNQYWFGNQLIVAAVTSETIKGINRSKVKVWLPDGLYFDVFTDMVYRGGRFLDMYRDLASIPVLAKAGAVVPVTEKIFGEDALENPEAITVKVYPGADGKFYMYEDDNESQKYMEGDCAITGFTWDWGEKKFTISPVQGNQRLIPESRDYRVEICCCTEAQISVYRNGIKESCQKEYDDERHILWVKVTGVKPEDEIWLEFSKELEIKGRDLKKSLFDFLNQAEIPFAQKRKIYDLVSGNGDLWNIMGQLQSMGLKEELVGSVSEYLLA
ncbi:MAG TPA: glycoside hydrolase family 31 protein [Candidatus Blautia pullistercoris]|uniref:Glycoside hydrolase family 31 protein n=1 Tax=Candidatus Blautia pullistercoris TaxID=2838499 RepID=A0A9D1VPB7_9FIRM|nr:glycoside hydrolase family 31 protein [Candidatus Blautia pullistercoris]